MKQDDLEQTRQQHLKRAMSVLVRAADYESVTSASLDILSSIAVLYMQAMFAQVHAYAEHATRTRPNMNDVGRALDERHISVANLDAYLCRERELCHTPTIAAALASLRALPQPPPQPLQAPSIADSSSVFFEDRAEGLLRQLVGNHIERAKERRRKEQLEKLSRIEAAASKARSDLAIASTEQTRGLHKSPSGREKSKLPSSAIDIDIGGSSDEDDFDNPDDMSTAHRRLIDPAEDDANSNQEDDHDDEDDEQDTRANIFTDAAAALVTKLKGRPRIRFSEPSKAADKPESPNSSERATENGQDVEDEDEDEDADFEAPTVSIAQPKPAEAKAAETSDDGPRRDKPAPAEKDGPEALSDEGKETDAPQSTQSDQADADEVEQLLLPTTALPEYVPVQCPLFPNPHTYKHTPVFPKREEDFFRNRMHKAEQSRQAEENLQRLISGPIAAESAATSPAPADETGAGPPNPSVTLDFPQEPTEPNDQSAQPAKRSPQQARKRILQLFPPANFRSADKRTRLTSFIKY
ncbi:hypothetical protein FB645_004839 [Coemansia sp. IMI 203386]|nr:hypothetical protein FB645_004839 [Coemansia sp. IMI 203386]